MRSRTSDLHHDERIVLDQHPHWVVLTGAVVLLVVAVAAGVWVYLLELTGILGDIVRIGVSVVILACLLFLLLRWAAWVTTRFVVTTRRCIHRQGVLSRHGLEVPHERIIAVSYHQRLLDRPVRSGSLSIEAVGELGPLVFDHVADPVRVQRVIHEHLVDDTNRGR